MSYSWGLILEIGITDFRDSHTDHTDTPRLCREVVHFLSCSFCKENKARFLLANQ